jgi:DNA/RNA endonuclease YhcR with UshA esterase domain
MTMRRFTFALLAMLGALAGPLAALTPEEASQHIGKEGAVDGIAVQVSQADGNVYVNLGAKYPDQLFTAFIAKANVPAVGLDYLKSLEGKPVSIVGRIVKMKGKPQIQVTKKDQIILAAQPAK